MMKATKILICIEDGSVAKAVSEAFALHAPDIAELGEHCAGASEAAAIIRAGGADLLVIHPVYRRSSPNEVNEMLTAARQCDVRITAVIEDLGQARTAILLGVNDSMAFPVQGTDLLKVLLMTKSYGASDDGREQEIIPDSQLVIHKHKRTSVLKYDEIMMLRAEGSYTEIICQNGEIVRVSKVIKTFDDMLRGAGFVRLGRSYLLNTRRIKEVQSDGDAGGCIVFHSGFRMHISHMLRKRLQNMLIQKESRKAI